MECDVIKEQLGLYIDQVLDECDMIAFQEHLARCAACRAELAALTTLIDAARSIEDIEVPSALREAIAAATTQRHKVPVVARLCAAFAPRSLRWAVGFAGAAVLLAGVAVLWHPLQLQTSPPKPERTAASTRAQVVPPRPAQVATAMTAVRAVSTRDKTIVTTRRLRRPARVHTVAQRGLPPVPNIKPGPKTAAVPAAPAPGESDAEVYGIDDTTVARTVSVEDIREPERVAASETPRVERIPIKVASAPLPKEEEVAQWLKDAKTAAEMHRRGNSAGVSLINARF